MFESTILYSRSIVYVKDYFQFEPTNTLPMVTRSSAFLLCVAVSHLGMVGFI